MTKLKWTDSEEIAIRLCEAMPEQDPLAVRFTDLRKWLCELPEFADDPKVCNEAKLEAIQMAWVQERQG
jgi:FeS assembly protein IscX